LPTWREGNAADDALMVIRAVKNGLLGRQKCYKITINVAGVSLNPTNVPDWMTVISAKRQNAAEEV